MRHRMRGAIRARVGSAPIGAVAAGNRRRAGVLAVAVSMVAVMLVALAPVPGQAQEPDQVTGLTVEQDQGFATLKWDPVPGATEYQIERTAVDANDEPTGDPVVVGIWRPNRQVSQEVPTFADAGFNPGDRFEWRVGARFGSGLPNNVVIDAPSSAAGEYEANGATFGPPPDETGIAGDVVLVNDGTDTPTAGCSPLIGFPAGAIALLDRGGCNYTVKVANAQAAGATAVIVVNNVGGSPPNMTGTDASITIPSVHVWQADGNAIKAGLPATGTVQSVPVAPLSDPVVGTTLPQWGDPALPDTEGLRTQWETTQAAQYTNDVNEYAYTAAVDEASDRVRVVELGRTLLDRPINMFIVGYPEPAATAEEISDGPAAMVNCNVHGNEPSSREACLILARELAFSTDPRIIDILSNTTVLIVPAINGDGRAANSRGNSTGQDLNRDHSLLRQPETFAFAEALRDYTPEMGFDGHEYGNSNAGDLPVLMPRHLNVGQTVFDATKSFIEDFLYVQGSEDGWWYCPYGCQGGGNVGLSQETILRNTVGLKNSVGILLEARSGGGPTRPDEGNTQNNRRRKTYSALYTYQIFLDYYVANRNVVAEAVDDAVEFQVSNTGEVVFRGSRPVPAFDAPHPGESPPPLETPDDDEILPVPPACYLLTEEQYNGERDDSPDGFPTTAAERLEAHGWTVDTRPAGYVVRLAQPQRGLIPLLLDDQAAEEMVDGQRLFECPHAEVDSDGLAAAAVEDTETVLELTVSNLAVEPDQDLDWSITEAVSSCDDPSDLGWLSVDPAAGTTGPSSSDAVAVTFDASGLTAPDVHSGVLCVSSNDPGDPVITVPVELQVQYPFSGFSDELVSVEARPNMPVRFSLDGDRGVDFIADGYPVSRPIDCATLEPTGSFEVVVPGGPMRYNPATDQYRYLVDAPDEWRGTCRQFDFQLDDASSHSAYFRFHR